jgi:putative ABC transport system permease protein
VNSATYPRRNLFRRRWRTILTVLAVAVAVMIFCLIRTAVHAWNVGAEEAAKDRIATRHKVSITMQLPKRYIDDVRKVDGIQAATWAVWFGGKDPQERVPFFAAFAADKDSWFDVLDEMEVDPQQLADWKATRNGAIIGDVLARSLGVTVGSDLKIDSDIYPGLWEFKVSGIYTPKRRTVDRNTMVFRWDFFNDDPRTQFSKDQIGWVLSRIKDPERSGEIQRAIDKAFDERDDQTISMSERAFNLQFLGAFSAVLNAFDFVALVILLIMALILANTVAMNVRERTHEYGVLRAIGFAPRQVGLFILAEALLIGVVGGLVGLFFTFGLVNNGLGPAIEENMGAWFPYFRAPGSVMGIALVAAALIGLVAGIVPAWRVSRRSIVDSLRRID